MYVLILVFSTLMKPLYDVFYVPNIVRRLGDNFFSKMTQFLCSKVTRESGNKNLIEQMSPFFVFLDGISKCIHSSMTNTDY